MRQTTLILSILTPLALSGFNFVLAQDAFDSAPSAKSKSAQAAPSGQGGMDRSAYNAMADHVNRGIKLMRGGSLQAALSEFEAARAIDPKNGIVKQNLAECHNHMGYELFRRKCYADASSEFEKCLAIFPSHGQARHNISLCKNALQQMGTADTDSDNEVQLEPRKGSEKSAGKEAETVKEKSLEPLPKTAGTSGASLSTSGAALFVSGSQAFPSYSTTPNAANTQTKAIEDPAKAAIVPSATRHDPALSPPALNKSLPAPAPTAATDRAGTASAPAGDIFENNKSTSAVSTPAAFSSTSSSLTAGSAAASSSAAGDGLTTEDKVSALELRVYGKKNSTLPLMKRIELLEADQFGQVHQGTMPERIENLKKAIGLN